MSVRVMADLYNAPELVAGYCKNECPVHGFLPLATEERGLQGITLRLLKSFNEESMGKIKDELIDIMEDGIIDDDEVPRLRKILDMLDGMTEVISEMKIAAEKVMKGR